jgi:hypothetical protein
VHDFLLLRFIALAVLYHYQQLVFLSVRAGWGIAPYRAPLFS